MATDQPSMSVASQGPSLASVARISREGITAEQPSMRVASQRPSVALRPLSTRTASRLGRVSGRKGAMPMWPRSKRRSLSIAWHGTRPTLQDWREQKIFFGFFRATTVLSRGRFILQTVLRLCTWLLFMLSGVAVSLKMPARAGGMYLALASWLILKLLSILASLTFILFNLIEFRRTSRVAFYSLREALGLRGSPGRVWRIIMLTFFRGRGAFVPKSPTRLFSDLFFGFHVGTFMVSYCWSPFGDSELPRRMAIELLPECPPNLPNKCWLDVENLTPGTSSVACMVSAVKQARFRFVFLSAACASRVAHRHPPPTAHRVPAALRTLHAARGTHTSESPVLTPRWSAFGTQICEARIATTSYARCATSPGARSSSPIVQATRVLEVSHFIRRRRCAMHFAPRGTSCASYLRTLMTLTPGSSCTR